MSASSHERLRALAIDKLPEIEELISRATAIRQLLITCAGCECDSLDECEIFEESIAAIPDRRPRVHRRRALSLR